MPVTIRFKAEVDELVREIDRFGAEAPAAEARALNATIVEVQREAVDRLAEAMGLPLETVKKETGVVKATSDRLQADLVVSGQRIPAIKFQAAQNERGVTYTVGGRSIFIPHAFIGRVGGHVAVLRRARGEGFAFGSGRRRRVATVAPSGLVERLPIFERRGPAVGAFLDHAEILTAITETTEEALLKNLNAELERLQDRRG